VATGPANEPDGKHAVALLDKLPAVLADEGDHDANPKRFKATPLTAALPSFRQSSSAVSDHFWRPTAIRRPRTAVAWAGHDTSSNERLVGSGTSAASNCVTNVAPNIFKPFTNWPPH
jgi:hypothetical protein